MSQSTEETKHQKIVKQIEYYFGDINLSRDNFLKDQLGKEDGWVAIDVLLTFNRLKSLTESTADVVTALQEIKSDKIELNQDATKIRRSTPLPVYDEEYKKLFKLRTVHLKGFPKEATLDQITEYCAQFGELEGVQMRRFKDKQFKGCIFAFYQSVEAANKAIESTEKFGGEHTLLRENKEDYFKRKAEFKVKKENRLANLNKGTGEGDEKESAVPKEVKFEPGCILKLQGVPETVAYHEIKSAFNEHSKVEYVEIFADKNEAIVRFASPADLKTATEKLKTVDENQEQTENNKEETSESSAVSESVTLNGNKVTTAVLTGEEETAYWQAVQKIRSQFSHKAKMNKNKFGKGMKGKKGSKRKFGRDDGNAKKAKLEA